MFSKLFPFKIHLTILQLFEYNLVDFWRWTLKNYHTRELENKKPLVLTNKIRMIIALSIIWLIILFLLIWQYSWFWASLICLLILSQDYTLLSLALLTIWPVNYYLKDQIKKKTRQKINYLKSKGLRVIGITGSFGKTTTKDFLYQILRSKYRILKTPESYNTILGIAKVVDLELDESYQYFICEYGAFKKGSIKELVETVPPDCGILTGINEQHLEQIGSIDAIVKEKFSFVQSIPKDQPIVTNFDNQFILKNYQKFDRNYIGYGSLTTSYKLQAISFNESGSKFDLILNDKKYSANTSVFGQSNLSNILAAATMASELKIAPKQIIQSIASLKPTPHRLEVKQLKNGITYIDNAFSSNPDGFKLALKSLRSFGKRPKILVTPGIILLASQSTKIHHQLGLFAARACDLIILVGHSDQTLALEEGVKNSKKIIFIDKITEVWPTIASLNFKKPVVLIENDLPDNFI